jgi:hypothetical protein
MTPKFTTPNHINLNISLARSLVEQGRIACILLESITQGEDYGNRESEAEQLINLIQDRFDHIAASLQNIANEIDPQELYKGLI